MRLWTLVDEEVWETLQRAEFLYANPQHSAEDDAWFTDCAGAYDWMRVQMHKRIAGYGGRYPWWAWHTVYGRRKVDLRDRNFFHWKGAHDYRLRLELNVPDGEVLLSDYDHWHAVLNACTMGWREGIGFHYWHTIPLSVREERAMMRHFEAMSYQERAAFCMKNWERIFLLNYPKRRKECGWGWGPAGQSQNIQACFEVLRLNQVVRVTRFKNRPVS